MKPNRLLLTIVFITSFFLLSTWVGHQIGTRARFAIAASSAGLKGSIKSGSLQLKLAHRFSEISKTPLRADQDASNPPTPPATNQAIPARQRNLLIIGIDDLKARRPSLVSIWMVFYLVDTPHFMLVPIYPSTRGFMLPELDENLANLFSIDKKGSLGTEFIQALDAKDLWWSGSIVLDQAALEGVQKFIIGKSNRPAKERLLAPSSIPDPRQNLQAALMGQTRFAQDICRSAVGLSPLETRDILALARRFSAHLHTDLDIEQMVGEVQSAMKNGGGITCEFPSLEMPPAQP